MSLPNLLSELAVLLPERVRLIEDEMPGYAMVTAYAERQWQTIFELAPTHGYASMHPFSDQVLEAALREECEARGWMWSIRRSVDNGNEAAVQARPRGRVYACSVTEELTPAEAFVGAMIQALKSEAAISESATKLK